MHEVYASFTGHRRANQPSVKRKWLNGVNEFGSSILPACLNDMRPITLCNQLICPFLGRCVAQEMPYRQMVDGSLMVRTSYA